MKTKLKSLSESSIFLTVLFAILCFAFYFSLSEFEQPRLVISHYRIHHSVIGVLIIVIGYYYRNYIIIALGTGIYVSHVIEEMYFNHATLLHALTIFITKSIA